MNYRQTRFATWAVRGYWFHVWRDTRTRLLHLSLESANRTWDLL